MYSEPHIKLVIDQCLAQFFTVPNLRVIPVLTDISIPGAIDRYATLLDQAFSNKAQYVLSVVNVTGVYPLWFAILLQRKKDVVKYQFIYDGSPNSCIFDQTIFWRSLSRILAHPTAWRNDLMLAEARPPIVKLQIKAPHMSQLQTSSPVLNSLMTLLKELNVTLLSSQAPAPILTPPSVSATSARLTGTPLAGSPLARTSQGARAFLTFPSIPE